MTDIYTIQDQPVAQGDMMICRVDALPENLVPADVENGNYVLTHSETGHHHVVKKQDGVQFYEANDNNKLTAFLVVNNPKEDVVVRHLRQNDTHAPLKFDNGTYIIRRQIESTGPEGWRRAID